MITGLQILSADARVEHALGRWSHLAAFPVHFRARVALRLGLAPSVQEYVQVWRLFGDPSLGPDQLRCVDVKDTVAVVVAPSQQYPDGLECFGPSLGIPELEGRGFQVVVGLDLVPAAIDREPQEVNDGGDDGWCARRAGIQGAGECGPWPTVAQLCEAGADRDSLSRAVTRVAPGVLHAGLQEVERRPVEVQGFDVVGGRDLTAVSIFSERVRDESIDFSVCRCRVHVPPRQTYAGQVVGCAAKSVGKAPVIAAASNGVARLCHAGPDTRYWDYQYLNVLYGVPRPVSLVFGGPYGGPEMVGESFHSEGMAPLDQFGRGYCYLLPVHAALRWRVARLLGPNPLCSDVLCVWAGSMTGTFKAARIECVSDGWYHVSTDKAAKGLDPSAGVKLYTALFDVVQACPTSRVGMEYILGEEPERPSTKVYCSVCRFHVSPDGHAQRCRPRHGAGLDEDESARRAAEVQALGGVTRKMAWIGDAVHKLDLRAVILASPVELVDAQVVASRYESRTAQATWFEQYRGEKRVPVSQSVAALSAAFEASYVGEFRCAYVRYVGAELQLPDAVGQVRAVWGSMFIAFPG